MDIVRRNEGVLFVGFILSQPVIDILTGLMTRYTNSVLTPGSLIRTLLLLFIVPYIWKELTNRLVVRMLFAGSIGAILLTALTSMLLKQPFLFTQEAIFYLKVLYYVVGLFFILIYIRKNFLARAELRRAIVMVGFLIGGSYFLALLTNTSFPSYPYGEIGFSGWFFSANELSVVVLLTFASLLTITRERPSLFSYATLVLLAGTGVLIGTKTATMGIALLLGIAFVELMWTTRRNFFRSKQTVVYIVLAIAFISVLPFSPMVENRAQHIEQANHPGGLQFETLEYNESLPMNNILSSRQDYAAEIAADFKQAPLIRKIVGLGYAGDYTKYPKMIEMDFLELFFSFGWLGSVILLIPLLYVSVLMVTRTSWRPENWMVLTGLALSLAVAAVAGHVLFAPSVMSYVVITACLLQERKKHIARM